MTYDEPNVILSGGPAWSRAADDDDPAYEPPRQPLGFARIVDVKERRRPVRVREAEPLLWDGDQA